MLVRRKDYNLGQQTVLGNAEFKLPFTAEAPLQNEARLVHIVKGNTKFHHPTGTLELKCGDSVLMKCENFVNNWSQNPDGTNGEVIVLILTPEILKVVFNDGLPQALRPNGHTAPPVAKISADPTMDNFIQGLSYYLQNPQLINEDLLKIKIKELILILSGSDQSREIKAILSDLFNTKEHAFKAIIKAHLFEDLNLEHLAYFAGMSLSSFKRRFKEVYDTSPNQYIKSKRLEKAAKLLTETDDRISDIAFDCGFNDLGYFSKAFNSQFKLSPSEFRKGC